MPKMTKYSTSTFLALLGAASINCTPPQQAKNPEQPDCSSINLQEKVGFETVVNPEEAETETICYKIVSRPSYFYKYTGLGYEYIGFCKPQGGTMEFYREFAGPNKGEIEMNYILDFLGSYAYFLSVRSPSGKIYTLTSRPISELEKDFKTGAKLLDSVKNSPKVCKKLQEYTKDNAAKH